LPISGQNLAQKGLACAKILLRALFGVGTFFDSSCKKIKREGSCKSLYGSTKDELGGAWQLGVEPPTIHGQFKPCCRVQTNCLPKGSLTLDALWCRAAAFNIMPQYAPQRIQCELW